jgi:hypothetical protein
MPEHSMMLEQQRHMAAQHERLEEMMRQVLEEVKQLRQEVRRLQPGETSESEPANP